MDDRFLDALNNPDDSQPFIQLGTPAQRREPNDRDEMKRMMAAMMEGGNGMSSSEYTYQTKDVEDGDESANFISVFEIYDFSFLVVIFICNFAQGFRRLLELGLYFVFKEKLGLQPAEVTLLLGIMAFPWVLKIFLAIFSDNVTCCGSRRKSYLIINAIVNIFSIIMLMIFGIMLGKWFILACIVLSQICMTWCDAVSDALIAQASRLDLKRGAVNLNSICVIAFAFGGIVACVCAGFIEMNADNDYDPNILFGVYVGIIAILLFASIFLNRHHEPEIILQLREREEH